MSSVRRVYPALPLVALCLVATALRVYRLDEAILSCDEGSSWRVSRYDPLELVRHCAANVHAPLSFFLLKAWTSVLGDSVFAMRSLSVLYGVLCVPLIYFAVLESARLRRRNMAVIAPRDEIRPDPRQDTWTHCGAFLAAALMAFHPLQLEVSRAARMYSLGALLTLASTWLLLRALQSGPRAAFAWFTFSLTAAALAYTHIYGLFAIAAQLAFAAGHVLRRARGTGILPASSGGGESAAATAAPPGKLEAYVAALLPVCFAAGMVLVLYSPWLPVLQSQTHEVSVKYWIAPLTLGDLALDLETWLFGEHLALARPGWLAASFLGLLLSLSLRHHPPGWLLFAATAIVPWLAACLFFYLTGNSVLQLRYLIPAQICLFLFTGVVFAAVARQYATSLAICLYLIVVAIHGTATVNDYESDHGEIDSLTAYVVCRHRPGDVVVVDDYRSLTRMQYYLHHAGMDPADVRTYVSPFSREGHTVHLGSLSSGDILLDWPPPPLEPSRLWYICAMKQRPVQLREWIEISSASFEIGRSTFISCYEHR